MTLRPSRLCIAVLNYSGNAGKTTVSRNLLHRHMPEAILVSVESVNEDGQEDLTLRGKQYSEVLDVLAVADHGAIVDIGASNAEDFLAGMKQARRSHQCFDLFVVPTMPGGKQTIDAIATIETLAQIGVPSQKIAVVCNGLEATDTVAGSFRPLIKYLKDTSHARLIEGHISANEVFNLLATHRTTLTKVLTMGQGPAATRSDERLSAEERLAAVRAMALVGMAETAAEELDALWRALVSTESATLPAM